MATLANHAPATEKETLCEHMASVTLPHVTQHEAEALPCPGGRLTPAPSLHPSSHTEVKLSTGEHEPGHF